MTEEKTKSPNRDLDEVSFEELDQLVEDLAIGIGVSDAAKAMMAFLSYPDTPSELQLASDIWFVTLLENRCEGCDVTLFVLKGLLLTQETIVTFSPLGLTHLISNTVLQTPDSNPYWIIASTCPVCKQMKVIFTVEASTPENFASQLKLLWMNFEKGYYPQLISFFSIQPSWMRMFLEHNQYDKHFAQTIQKKCLQNLLSTIQDKKRKQRRKKHLQEQLVSGLFVLIQDAFSLVQSELMFCGLLKGVWDYLLMFNGFQQMDQITAGFPRNVTQTRLFIRKLKENVSKIDEEMKDQILGSVIQMVCQVYHDLTGVNIAQPTWILDSTDAETESEK